MKLYDWIVRILRVLNHLYFVDIRTAQLERMPATGPVMLAANHPSSVLDAIILSTQIRRRINYLARSGLFRFPLLAGLFRLLGVIPIYRPHEVSDHANRNQDIFSQVYELFDAGGCLGVFPEGRNSPRGKIGELRKGIARIALGAEAQRDWQLGLVIVPAGVNLENRAFLSSAALLRIGRPIRVADYADQYRDNPERAVRALTLDVQTSLRRQALHLENEQVARLVDDLSETLDDATSRIPDLPPPEPPRPQRFFKRWLGRFLGLYRRGSPETAAAFQRRVYNRQFIGQVLDRAIRNDPDRVNELRLRVERYRDHVSQTEVRQALANSQGNPIPERLLRLRMTVFAVLMAPLALFGLVHNILPYLFARFGALLIRDEAVRAFTYFGLVVVGFGACYALLGWWLWYHTEFGLARTLVYIAALPPTGFVALGYRREVLRYRDKILVRTLLWNQRELVELLRTERDAIRDRMAILADRYGDPEAPSSTNS